MRTVLTVQEMRDSDAAAIRGGVPGKELMRRAGEGIVGAYPFEGKTCLLCGSGNNAGDGYVVALLLSEKGIPCRVCRIGEKTSESGEYYLSLCREKGIPISFFDETEFFGDCREVVDCLFGTGFSGELTGLYREAALRVNRAREQGRIKVVSADINSGLDGENGNTKLCIESDLTVSVGCTQPGHHLGAAMDVMKELKEIDVGIKPIREEIFLPEPGDLKKAFAPRTHSAHKGTYGYVGIMGGSREYTGAVKLANLGCAAMRAGAGVAALALPESLLPAVAPYLLETTAFPMPETEDGHTRFDPVRLGEFLQKKEAVAVGMGWGRSGEYQKILLYLLEEYRGKLLLDADALNTLSGMENCRELLGKAPAKIVITPHRMEFSRLSGRSMEEIGQDPIGTAKSFAAETGTIVLLKGCSTVVTDGKVTYLCDRGCPGMATAGSGDVLSGILAGLLGSAKCDPLTVACGAWIAGRAGEIAESKINPVSMIASDTVGAIPLAVSELLQAKCNEE